MVCGVEAWFVVFLFTFGAVWCAEIYLPLVLKKKLRKRNCDLLTTGLKSDVLFGDFVDGDGVLG